MNDEVWISDLDSLVDGDSVALCREFSRRRGLGRQGSSVLLVSNYGHLGGWVLYADECASLHFWREMHRKAGLVIFFNSYFDELWILRHSFCQKNYPAET